MFYEQPGAERAVQMLIKKLNGEAFRTEYPMPVFDRVEPRPAIADISKATIAIVTSGGIVPFGNPDHIAASSAQNYGAYDLDGVTDLRKGEYMTAHGGYDQTYANADPDRVLPIGRAARSGKGRQNRQAPTMCSTVPSATARP